MSLPKQMLLREKDIQYLLGAGMTQKAGLPVCDVYLQLKVSWERFL